MKRNSILPSVVKIDQLENNLIQLTYVFNRWLKMLTKYGKLDHKKLEDDLNLVSRVIDESEISRDIKGDLSVCRFYAMRDSQNKKAFKEVLIKVLKKLCMTQEDTTLKRIKKHEADIGMTERYRPLSKKLEKEKIRKLGKRLPFLDINSEEGNEAKLIRRFIEKRAAQNVHRLSKKHNKKTNQYRQSVRRATSFCIYNTNFTDYNSSKRAPGTHWKKYTNKKGNKVLKSNKSYETYEDAMRTCESINLRNSKDEKMSAYKCKSCGKWHIGHKRRGHTHLDLIGILMPEAS